MKTMIWTTAVKVALVILVGILTFAPCFAALTLDSTFASGGRFTRAFPDTTTNYSSSGSYIFVQPGGRIVAAGEFTRWTPDGNLPGFVLFGLLKSGTLDGGYSEFQDWDPSSRINLRDSMMYADGRLLILGRSMNVVGSSTIRSGRIGAGGISDAGYLNQIGSFGGFGTASPGEISLRSDEKISALIKDNGELQLYRLNSNGTRDATFGSNGIVRITFNKIPTPSEGTFKMFSLPDGKTLIIGQVPAGGGPGGLSSIFLARFTDTGLWDKSFGHAGFLIHSFEAGTGGSVADALLLPDGKLLLCGGISGGGDTDVFLMRLQPNGRRDNSFGTNGLAIRDFLPGGSDFARGIATSPDGKIRIVGDVGAVANFLVARFSETGVYEDHMSFEFTPGQPASGNDIAMQPDGKIIVIGNTRNLTTTFGNMFAVARLTE